MDIKTYRASTMHEALAMVRQELGPDAAVLHTREVPAGRWWSRLRGSRQIEVTASAAVNVPSRFARAAEPAAVQALGVMEPPPAPPRVAAEPGWAFPDEVKGQLTDLQSMLQDLCRQSRRGGPRDLPETLFRLFTDLIEADVNEDVARQLVDRVRNEASNEEVADPLLIKARVARMVEEDVSVAGPIAVTPGRSRLVALVGPTGVGKTTTIAKLAAQYRLKRKHNVGLITVDTYRIAAVEQLRTYAEIIDLPMLVVSTPREMRDAVRRMRSQDLILLDTAGRSPKDDIKIRELKAFLTEAGADEVHLVLSAVASARTLEQTAQRFAAVGTTRLLLTKLDEASSFGSLLPLVRSCKLPLSYLTNGQNVPDDIEIAEPGRVARLVLAMESAAE